MNRGKAGKRVTLMLAAAGTMLLLTCGAVLAAEVIRCEPNHACKGTAKSDSMSGSQASDKMMARDQTWRAVDSATTRCWGSSATTS